MIHLLYGKDSFRLRRALAAIRDALAASDGMLASNTTVLDGETVTPDELLAHVTAMPFLASNRLVIVEGLLRQLGGERRGRRKKDGDDASAAWRDVAVKLSSPATMPPTTTVIFAEADLPKSNPGFAIFAKIAKVQEFRELPREEIAPWIEARAAEIGVELTLGAMRSLAAMAGADLWTIENALRKLAAYADGAIVDERDVARLVAAAQDAKFWEMTDAVVAGDERTALAALRRLLTEGEPAPLLAFMLARQYRTFVFVKDLQDRGASRDEIARATGAPPFKVNAIVSLASRYTWQQLRAAYGLMLDADLSVKRGLQDDESSLQLLVHELCAVAPRRAPSRGAYAR